MKHLVLSDEVVEDLEGAFDFYDRLEPGLGRKWVASLLDDSERLGSTHGIHPKVHGLHRALGSRFPFGIYYVDEDEAVRVLAILDLRRDPTWIRRELSRRDP